MKKILLKSYCNGQKTLGLYLCDLISDTNSTTVLRFSILSQTGKCMATVRAALVQCLVTLLEVSSYRGFLDSLWQFIKLWGMKLCYIVTNVSWAPLIANIFQQSLTLLSTFLHILFLLCVRLTLVASGQYWVSEGLTVRRTVQCPSSFRLTLQMPITKSACL